MGCAGAARRYNEFCQQGEQNNMTTTATTVSAIVIFDSGGGVTVQLSCVEFGTTGTWSHYYQDGSDAAADVSSAIANGTFFDFDGDEPESAELVPTDEQLRNGGYRVSVFASADELKDFADNKFFEGWGNEREFARKILAATI